MREDYRWGVRSTAEVMRRPGYLPTISSPRGPAASGQHICEKDLALGSEEHRDSGATDILPTSSEPSGRNEHIDERIIIGGGDEHRVGDMRSMPFSSKFSGRRGPAASGTHA
ncbi:hypothetical protein M413DRAFT_26588 [Hebeloma cylindrosporum]|uniref:Uncharacterized protein n=1 Tax=Hebeloma cylindrosporum TaxID=76867 RepID=A0A0C2XY22_HEBCY|nr:hypothetical protein M413DRAFT_26588 [Hebeloma cylindrosporum h7]